MENNMNTENQENTFTQDDVNRIVGERLAKEKSKADAEMSKRETELARRELQMTAKEMLSEKKLPVELVEALNCTDKEMLDKSISIIENAFEIYKNNLPKPKFVGVEPGASSGILPRVDAAENAELRRAMRLEARKE